MRKRNLSRRVQKAKAREETPTEEKEDSESDSSSLDKELIMRLFEKMEERLDQLIDKIDEKFDKINEKFNAIDTKIEKNNKAMARAFGNMELEFESKVQQEASKRLKPVLETGMGNQDEEGLGCGPKDVCRNCPHSFRMEARTTKEQEVTTKSEAGHLA